MATLLRLRGLGNSPQPLQKKLEEQHGIKWLEKTCRYLTDCEKFRAAASVDLLTPIEFAQPPKQIPVPKSKWLRLVYALDALSRVDDVKAALTFMFGRLP